MKRIVLIGLAVSLTFSIHGMAQKNRNEFSTIFDKEDSNKIEHGGYGSFGFGYSEINGKDALLANFKAAWLINHRLGFGFAGSGFVNNLDKKQGSDEYYLSGGYGGFLIEPILMPKSPIHLSFPVVIGAGGVAVLPNNFWDNAYNNINEYDIYFVVEPGVELELNVVKFFRISMGAAYRITNGVLLNTPDNQPVDLDALDGITYNLNFKFGKF